MKSLNPVWSKSSQGYLQLFSDCFIFSPIVKNVENSLVKIKLKPVLLQVRVGVISDDDLDLRGLTWWFPLYSLKTSEMLHLIVMASKHQCGDVGTSPHEGLGQLSLPWASNSSLQHLIFLSSNRLHSQLFAFSAITVFFFTPMYQLSRCKFSIRSWTWAVCSPGVVPKII